MHDSITASDIPTSATMVAGYVSGTWTWSAADWARFPHATKVRIATHADVNDGHVLDVETGDATPAEAPGWVTMRRAAGVTPTVYMNNSTWASVKAAFVAQGVAQPNYWVAHYDADPAIPSGGIAKQYLWDGNPCNSGGHYDISSVADFWPGIDPNTPAPSPVVEVDMVPNDMWNSQFSWVSRQDGKTYVSTFHQFAQNVMQLSESYNPGRSAVGPAGTMATYIADIKTQVDTAATKSTSVTISQADLQGALTAALATMPTVDASAVALAVTAELSKKLGA